MTPWRPTVSDGPKPLYERLIDTLERDIATGALAAGAKLPPQRDLAHHLKIGVGTVTRAYAEAERRGLLTAHVGRGSFVSGSVRRPLSQPANRTGPIDMARNLPPLGPARAHIAEAVGQLRNAPDLLEAVNYGDSLGAPAHRRAIAAWLERTSAMGPVDWNRILLCTGGHQGMNLAFGAICAAGDVILCEDSTFYGVKALADHAGYRLQGVALDDDGLLPQALDAAIRATGARLLYLQPTLHNPTGRTMSADRRAAIVEVARRHDLWIVEDDVYGHFAHPIGLKPLALLAPERVFHVSSLSKAIAPGLRVGFVIPPLGGGHTARITAAIRATSYASEPFGRMIATRWIEDGTAFRIADAIIAETRQRTELAFAYLGHRIAPPSGPACLHIWLPMSELEAEQVAGRALRAGVELTPPAACCVGPATGLRLCLGGPDDIGDLERGLTIVATALASGAETSSRAIV